MYDHSMRAQAYKRHHRLPLLFSGTMLLFYSPQALALTEGNYTYTTNGAGQATITGFNSNYNGALSITNILGGCPVTAIESRAFAFCHNITAIAIPSSIISIVGDPFFWGGGQALTNITVDAVNIAYASAEGVLFDKNFSALIRYPSGKREAAYTVPNGVTSIGNAAFAGNFNITSIAIPDSVSVMGERAFASCWDLSSVNIPDGITHINTALFDGCSALTAISLPDTVTYIGDYAFKYCSLLTSVNIPNGVTYIGAEALSGVRLTSVTIPVGVTNICDGTFSFCDNLTSITIPDNITSIGAEAFKGSGLVSVTVPGSVTNIGDHAFASCPDLVIVSIAASVTAVGNYAFYDCLKLTSVLFKGDPPALGGSDVFFFFLLDYPAVVYYLPGASDWGNTFGGCTTVCWNPTIQSAMFDGDSGRFGLTVTGNAHIPVVVEVCTNLSEGAWTPVVTNTLGAAGALDFNDSAAINYPSRFYRIAWP